MSFMVVNNGMTSVYIHGPELSVFMSLFLRTKVNNFSLIRITERENYREILYGLEFLRKIRTNHLVPCDVHTELWMY